MTIELEESFNISLEDKPAVKVEEIIESANGTSDVTKMWDALDHAFLPIDHCESQYRQFFTRCMRQGERMTEYLDELICLFRKARPGAFIQFQNEEVKNHLINGLPSQFLAEVQGYTWT